MAALICRLIPPLQNHKEGGQPNSQERTPQWDGLGHEGDVPDQGAGAGQGGIKVLYHNTKAVPVPLP